MSINNKLDAIAEYVHHNLPELNLGNVSVKDDFVNDICNSVFPKTKDAKTKDLKRNIVNALNRENASLRIILNKLKDNTLTSNICNDTLQIMKYIESCNYTLAEFEHYDDKVLDTICKKLKVTINQKNKLSVYKKCKKVFNNDSFNSNFNIEADKCMTIEHTPTLIQSNSHLVTSYSVSVVEDKYETLKTIDLNNCSYRGDEVENNTGLILNEACTPSTKMSFDTSAATFQNIVTSTPEEKKSDFTEKLIKTSCNKYKKVESPLKSMFFKRTPVKSGVVLPLGTKNKYLLCNYDSRENNDNNFRGCRVFEGKFCFTNEEWLYIVQTDEQGKIRLQETKYPTMFRKRLKTVNNTCVVNFKSVNYPKTMKHILVYMYCSHPGCKSFKLRIVQHEAKTEVLVYSSSLDYYHNPNNSLTNHVRGIERDLLRQTLKETKAFKYTDEAVKCASPSKLKCGNLQTIKSDSTIRKIRSEALCEDDFAKEDLEDLLEMYKNENYVQHVGLPSYVHCYSDEQLDLLTMVKSKNGGKVTGYLDATGTVVRKINVDSKRVLYYAIVLSASLPGNSSVTCPIVEMVSSSHDITAISQWLNAFKAFVLKKKHEWPLFTNIVTDFSYAQMHSICIGWNGFSSIFDYLNWCYSVLFEQRDGTKMTIINVCVNHYTKIIVNHVRTHYLKYNKNVRGVKRLHNDIIDWICLMFNMDCMLDVEMWFELFIIILSSRTKTHNVYGALNVMQKRCTTVGNPMSQLSNDENGLDNIDMVDCESQTSKSMMYYRFKRNIDFVQKKLDSDFDHGNEINEYYDVDFLEQFTLKCVPFIPLWTLVMNKIVNNGVEGRQSNATVEAWYKTVKIDMLNGDRRLKCGRFVRKLNDRAKSVCKQVKFSIRKNRCTRILFSNEAKLDKFKSNVLSDASTHSKLNSIDQRFLEDEEAWGKKEKPHRHLQPIGYRPFKKLKLNNPIQLLDIGKELVARSVPVSELKGNCIDNILDVSVKELETKESVTLGSRKSMVFCKESFSTSGSHNSPFRRDSFMMDLYENMLPKDLSYYQLTKMPNGSCDEYYTVGKYNYISGKKIDVTLGLILTELGILDFDTLSGDNWLSNFVIDICLALNAIKLNLENVKVMTCNTVTSLMGDLREKIVIEENSTVYMPWNINGNHWIVAVVNFSTNNCFIMNPFNPVSIDDRNCFNLLFKSLKKNCLYGNCGKQFPELNFISCPMDNVPRQTDCCNCGVFIIYYTFIIMAKLNFDQDFNPTEYRDYLKKYLLENSEDMTNICLFCGHHSDKHRCKQDESCVGWVSCTRCCRWVAIHCMPEKYRHKDYENRDFLCPLCASKNWTESS